MSKANSQNSDPIKKKNEKETNSTEYSPINPPDAYAPPSLQPVPYGQMPPFLQKFMDEHRVSLKEIESLEQALILLRENGLSPNPEVDHKLQQFFKFLDEKIVPHNLREEKLLFPLLQQRLLESGEHSKGKQTRTSVDMLEDDHIKLMQLSAVIFNFLALAARLPDPASRAMVLDAALAQGQTLVEELRLHIFREDNVVFPLAVQHLTRDEFEQMAVRAEKNIF